MGTADGPTCQSFKYRKKDMGQFPTARTSTVSNKNIKLEKAHWLIAGKSGKKP
jgi:hypothetical protein